MRWDMVDFMTLIISLSHHFPTLLDLVDLEDIVSVAFLLGLVELDNMEREYMLGVWTVETG